MEDFSYLGVLYTSDGRLENELDRQMGSVTVIMQEAAKRNLSMKAKSICVPTPNYSHETHELWVVTESECFLCRVSGLFLRFQMQSSDIREVEMHLVRIHPGCLPAVLCTRDSDSVSRPYFNGLGLVMDSCAF